MRTSPLVVASFARQARRREANFKQSRGVREDRGERQSKMAGVRRALG